MMTGRAGELFVFHWADNNPATVTCSPAIAMGLDRRWGHRCCPAEWHPRAAPPRAGGPLVALQVVRGGDRTADGHPLPTPRPVVGSPKASPSFTGVKVSWASQLPLQVGPSPPPSAGQSIPVLNFQLSTSPCLSRAFPDTSFHAPSGPHA